MPAADIVHELAMRWADIDALDHVNNVVYLDYAAESRALLVDAGVVGADERPSHTTIDFLRSILLSREPVLVTSRRDGDVLTQAIRPAGADDDYARVVTVLGAPADPAIHPGIGPAGHVRLRRSDLDPSGCVTTTKMFELFQEIRIQFVARRLTSLSAGRFVVAHIEVDEVRPIRWQASPLEASSWIRRIGDSSVTVESQIRVGDTLLAQSSTVMVAFDLPGQSARRLSDEEKTQLAHLIAQS